MTSKTFLTTTGTVSLKALRALWRAFAAMVSAFAWALVECMKYASDADEDSNDDKPYGHESAEYYNRAAANQYRDWYGD